MKEIVELLRLNHKTLATMESCTGGGVVNSITNVEGASDILNFSAITYSNEFKIKMGVSSSIIEKYSVYSMETAIDMSRAIGEFTNSDYGIGITGKLNGYDKNNESDQDNVVFISIYEHNTQDYLCTELIVTENTREKNKQLIIEKVAEMMMDLLNKMS